MCKKTGEEEEDFSLAFAEKYLESNGGKQFLSKEGVKLLLLDKGILRFAE